MGREFYRGANRVRNRSCPLIFRSQHSLIVNRPELYRDTVDMGGIAIQELSEKVRMME